MDKWSRLCPRTSLSHAGAMEFCRIGTCYKCGSGDVQGREEVARVSDTDRITSDERFYCALGVARGRSQLQW